MKINLPTKITLARMALIPLVLVFYYLIKIHPAFILAMTLVYILAACTDFIDGHIARSRNMVTTLGKFLDPIADKILVVTGLFIIVNSGILDNNGLLGNDYGIGMIGCVIIMARELSISAFRQIAATKGVVMAADKWGKLKTVFTLVAIPTIMMSLYMHSDNEVIAVIGKVLWWIGFVMFILSVVLTIVSGINYLVKNKQVFNDDKQVKVEKDDLLLDATAEDISEETTSSDDIVDENQTK